MRRPLRRGLAAMALMLSATLVGHVPAGAVDNVDCWKVEGTVTDRLGRAAGNVRVRTATPCSDRPGTGVTSASGAYSLYLRGTVLGAEGDLTATDLASPARFDSKRQLVSVRLPTTGASNRDSAVAPVVSGGDFRLALNLHNATASPGAVPAGSSATISAELFAAAPPATPSARLLAERPDGTSTVMTAVSGAGGWTAWETTVANPVGTADGKRTAKLCAVPATVTTGTCGSNSASLLSRIIDVTYTVDSSPPMLGGAIPAQGGATMFTSQPLLIRVTDGSGSGIAPASILLTLHNLTMSTTQTFSGAAVSFDATSGWAKTAPVSLTAGHRYRLEATASDLAGNTAIGGQRSSADGFDVVTATAAPGSASIPFADCELSASPTPGFKTATCSNVVARVAGTASGVSLSKVGHAGEGRLLHTLPVRDVVVVSDTAGQRLALPAASDTPAWSPKSIVVGFDANVASSTATTLSTPAYDANIGTLTTTVPATWTEAHLELGPTPTQVDLQTCADPTVVTQTVARNCIPDPIQSQKHFGWHPPSRAAHTYACDSLVTHKPRVMATPDQDLGIEVSVAAPFVPTSATLHYRRDYGATSSITAAVSGSVFSLIIPAAALADGTRLEYWVDVIGSATSGPCTSSLASTPSNSAALVAAADPANRAAFEIASEALGASLHEPRSNDTTTWTINQSFVMTLCSRHFTSPTPCELFEGDSPHVPSAPTAQVPPSVPPLKYSSTTVPYRVCWSSHGWSDYELAGETGGSGVGIGRRDQFTSGGAQLLQAHAYASAGAAGNRSAEATRRGVFTLTWTWDDGIAREFTLTAMAEPHIGGALTAVSVLTGLFGFGSADVHGEMRQVQGYSPTSTQVIHGPPAARWKKSEVLEGRSTHSENVLVAWSPYTVMGNGDQTSFGFDLRATASAVSVGTFVAGGTSNFATESNYGISAPWIRYEMNSADPNTGFNPSFCNYGASPG